MNSKIIVYPISANPPTFGHADILLRASKKFDQIYWVAAVNNDKKAIISVDTQLKMMNDYVSHYQLKNIISDSCDGSIVRYAQEKKADFILRGIRNLTDIQSEMDLAIGYRGISSDIETICMFANPGLNMVSSSLVRELAKVGERIDQYVLPSVSDELKQILSNLKSNS